MEPAFDNTSSVNSENKYIFVLFISGMSVKSIHAIENLRAICETYLQNNFELSIIDISQQPGLASEYHIIATPTLIKKEPAPQKIILGDLSNIKKVLNALDIIPK